MMPPLVISLSAAQAATASDGWVTIGYLGQYNDRRYGDFKITAEQVAHWQRNLAAGAVTGEPNRVALDYEHSMDDPNTPGSAKRASGWVKEIRLNGDAIQARIEWTPAARDAIQNGEFRYFSPTFAERFRNDQGEDLGPTLIGGALTNRPFLRSKGALCVQLAQGHLEPVDPDDEERDPPYWTLRNVSTEERDKLADKGAALPDGSYPIANEGDLRNAIQAIGRAKDPARAKAHIRKRAKALGREDLLPDDWKTASQDDDTDWIRLRDALHEQLVEPVMTDGRMCSCGAKMRKGQDHCPQCGKTLAQSLSEAFSLAQKRPDREEDEKKPPNREQGKGKVKDAEFERLHPRGGGGLFVVKEGDDNEEAKGAEEKLGADLTEAEIRKFQKEHNLKVDGEIGRQTASALLGNKSASKLETGGITGEQREKLRDAARKRKRKAAQPYPDESEYRTEFFGLTWDEAKHPRDKVGRFSEVRDRIAAIPQGSAVNVGTARVTRVGVAGKRGIEDRYKVKIGDRTIETQDVEEAAGTVVNEEARDRLAKRKTPRAVDNDAEARKIKNTRKIIRNASTDELAGVRESWTRQESPAAKKIVELIDAEIAKRKRKSAQDIPRAVLALSDDQVQRMLGRDTGRTRMDRIRRSARLVLLHSEP